MFEATQTQLQISLRSICFWYYLTNPYCFKHLPCTSICWEDSIIQLIYLWYILFTLNPYSVHDSFFHTFKSYYMNLIRFAMLKSITNFPSRKLVAYHWNKLAEQNLTYPRPSQTTFLLIVLVNMVNLWAKPSWESCWISLRVKICNVALYIVSRVHTFITTLLASSMQSDTLRWPISMSSCNTIRKHPIILWKSTK